MCLRHNPVSRLSEGQRNLRFLVNILTIIVIAEPISSRALELRQADPTKCESNSYTSQNGLNFTTYCGQNNPFNGTFFYNCIASPVTEADNLQTHKTRSNRRVLQIVWNTVRDTGATAKDVLASYGSKPTTTAGYAIAQQAQRI